MKSVAYFTLSFFLILNINFAQDFEDVVSNPFSLTGDGVRSSPTFADLDDDGDLDLITGLQSGDYGFYDNIGFNDLPSFGSFTLEPFSLGPIGGDATPFLIDMDDDGDFDVVSGGDGGIRYFENLGNATVASFPFETSNPWDIIAPSGISKPYFVDIDNDGDPDLFSGSSDGNIYFYENIGSLGDPDFNASVTNAFGFVDVGTRSAPSFVDIDLDGDFDAFVGEHNGGIYYFENIGNVELAEFDSIGVNLFGISYIQGDSKPSFADLDDDGDQDLMVGGVAGDYYYFENISTGLEVKEKEFGAFNIYPNPASTLVYLKSEQIIDKVRIYNQVGQLIIQESGNVNSIDVSKLTRGIYIIELEIGLSKFREKLLLQ